MKKLLLPSKAFSPVYDCNVTIKSYHYDSNEVPVIAAKPDNYDGTVLFRESELYLIPASKLD